MIDSLCLVESRNVANDEKVLGQDQVGAGIIVRYYKRRNEVAVRLCSDGRCHLSDALDAVRDVTNCCLRRGKSLKVIADAMRSRSFQSIGRFEYDVEDIHRAALIVFASLLKQAAGRRRSRRRTDRPRW